MLARSSVIPRLVASAAAARSLASKRPSFPAAALNARFMSVPRTADKAVQVTFINVNGERLKITAMEGQTLYEAAVNNKVEIGNYMTCHVVLSPDSYKAHSPPFQEELDILDSMEDVAPTSRMASMLMLDTKVKDTYVALTSYRDPFQI